MKRISYFVNGEEIGRSSFYKELRSTCIRNVNQMVIAGWCGVDVREFDPCLFGWARRSILKETHTIIQCGDTFTKFNIKRNNAQLAS